MKFWRTKRFSDTLTKVSMSMDVAGIRYWALIGGNAADVWSNPIATEDIDIAIDSEVDEFSILVTTLTEDFGFSTELIDTEEGYAFAFMRDPETAVRVDLLLYADPLGKKAARGAIKKTTNGLEFRLAKPEHVIALKMQRGARKDLQAVIAVLKSTKINKRRLRESLEEAGISRPAIELVMKVARSK